MSVFVVIYIAGYGRSRSTFLERSLVKSGQSNVLSAGELTNLPAKLNTNALCQCGEAAQECPVWSALFPDQAQGSHFGEGASSLGRLHRDDLQRRRSMIDHLMRSSYEAIIDSSKTSIAHLFRPHHWRRTGSRTVVLLPVRRLSEVIESRIAKSMRDGRPQGKLRSLLLALETVVSWYVANLAALAYRPIIIDSDALAADPDRLVAEVYRRVDVPMGAGGAEHMVAGNRMRLDEPGVAETPEVRRALSKTEKLVATLGSPLHSALIARSLS